MSADKDRFTIRFMKGDETEQVSALINALQVYQKMKGSLRIPTSLDIQKEILQTDTDGNCYPNKYGTFIAVAIDSSRIDSDQPPVIAYLIYVYSYSILNGRQFYVTSFFIDEGYRRHGIGRKFIQFIKYHANLVGIHSFDVPFMNDNVIGQKFYKSFGSYLVNGDYFLININHNELLSRGASLS